MRRILIVLAVSFINLVLPTTQPSYALDYSVYSIYQGLNLGGAGEVTQKDFYVNMGSSQGIVQGVRLQVYRHTPTFDLVSQQVYRDVTFPIAIIKVIHVEPNVAIARLERFLPVEQSATISPRAIMVGDLVKITDRVVIDNEVPVMRNKGVPVVQNNRAAGVSNAGVVANKGVAAVNDG